MREFCRTCGHLVHTVASFCICGCTDGYPARAGQAPDTSPAPDAPTSAEPSAPPAATGESDVLRTASAGEAHGRSGLTHAEWSALTDAANQGTDELLIEAVERIIAARLFAIEAERDQWKEVAHDGAFQQARAEALARQAAAVEALADEWRNKANGAILYRHARHSLLAALRGDA